MKWGPFTELTPGINTLLCGYLAAGVGRTPLCGAPGKSPASGRRYCPVLSPLAGGTAGSQGPFPVGVLPTFATSDALRKEPLSVA